MRGMRVTRGQQTACDYSVSCGSPTWVQRKDFARETSLVGCKGRCRKPRAKDIWKEVGANWLCNPNTVWVAHPYFAGGGGERKKAADYGLGERQVIHGNRK